MIKYNNAIENNNIYLSDNPYGFKVNINHVKINPLYRRYKVWKGINLQDPLTDEQRFEFEKYILDLIQKGKGDTEEI